MPLAKHRGQIMSRPNNSLNQAKRALRECRLHPLRALAVEQAGESIIISGRVNSFYHKQMAQEIVRAVCNDIELRNNIDVET